MNAQELAQKFKEKVRLAAVEAGTQQVAEANSSKIRHADVSHCKRAMTDDVVPFFGELEAAFPDDQFSFVPYLDPNDHQAVSVAFRIGDGPPTTISTFFGTVMVTHAGASGSSKGDSFVYAPDAEPFISNSGDLTREKVARLVEMVIDNT